MRKYTFAKKDISHDSTKLKILFVLWMQCGNFGALVYLSRCIVAHGLKSQGRVKGTFCWAGAQKISLFLAFLCGFKKILEVSRLPCLYPLSSRLKCIQ